MLDNRHFPISRQTASASPPRPEKAPRSLVSGPSMFLQRLSKGTVTVLSLFLHQGKALTLSTSVSLLIRLHSKIFCTDEQQLPLLMISPNPVLTPMRLNHPTSSVTSTSLARSKRSTPMLLPLTLPS